jgi:hypothetical protein
VNNHRVVATIMAAVTLMGSAPHAQERDYRNDKAAKAERFQRAQERAAMDPLMRTRFELLEKSMVLQRRYAETEKLIEQTQVSLAKAKETCIEVCTSDEMKDAVELIRRVSETVVDHAVFLNGLRTLYGFLRSDNQLERGIKTYLSPLDTRLGRTLVIATPIWGLAALTKRYLESEDRYTKLDITMLENDLAYHKNELNRAQVNMDINNRAIEHTLLLEQAKAETK